MVGGEKGRTRIPDTLSVVYYSRDTELSAAIFNTYATSVTGGCTFGELGCPEQDFKNKLTRTVVSDTLSTHRQNEGLHPSAAAGSGSDYSTSGDWAEDRPKKTDHSECCKSSVRWKRTGLQEDAAHWPGVPHTVVHAEICAKWIETAVEMETAARCVAARDVLAADGRSPGNQESLGGVPDRQD
ncbi:hypothetical protein BaRGS_00039240 [Batillaria attramentaria]|uniref:Uncharacterized protein n=1 Tax=Batillaria attramentaria TaxID=370345 RepID=A0ABD0J4J3_9CAEN